jgi:hypothetical protein
MARALGINPGLVSRLVKRGMPLSSVDSANAWRTSYAPPRNRSSRVEYHSAPTPTRTETFQPLGFNVECLEFTEAELVEQNFDESPTV